MVVSDGAVQASMPDVHIMSEYVDCRLILTYAIRQKCLPKIPGFTMMN